MIDLRKTLPEELSSLPDDSFEQVQEGVDLHDEVPKTKSVGFYRDALIRLKQSKVSVIAFWLITIIILCSIFVPMFTGYTYTAQNVKAKNLPPRIPVLEKIGIADGTMVLTNKKKTSLDDTKRFPEGCVLEIVKEYEYRGTAVVDVKVDYYKYCGVAEGEYHWFGTDYLGRDLMTRMFMGTRISLIIAFISVITNVIIGVIYGALSGYYGGKLDMVLTHLAEVLDGLPYVVVTILFMLLFGSGMFSIIIALCATGWIGTSRLIRAQFYRFKGREYVMAARTLGVRDAKLIFRHILPNTVGPLITRAMIAIPGAIFSEAFLAYIGLGIKAPQTSVGILLSEGQDVLLQYPFQTFFPAILISILMVAFNLFSNGLRDAMDPTRRGEEA